MRDRSLENRQPAARYSPAQDGRIGTPTIVGFAFPIALPNRRRVATSYGRLLAPNDRYSPDLRRARYSAPATVVSKLFRKNLQTEMLRQEAVKSGCRGKRSTRSVALMIS